MSRTHYHVIENTPGYLPEDDEPFITYSVTAARQYAKSRADQYRHDWDGDYTVRGNMRDGYVISDHAKMYDLGRVIKILDCTDDECAPSDDA